MFLKSLLLLLVLLNVLILTFYIDFLNLTKLFHIILTVHKDVICEVLVRKLYFESLTGHCILRFIANMPAEVFTHNTGAIDTELNCCKSRKSLNMLLQIFKNYVYLTCCVTLALTSAKLLFIKPTGLHARLRRAVLYLPPSPCNT